MISLSKKVYVNASAPLIWAKVGAFSNLSEWHPSVHSSRGFKSGGDVFREVMLINGTRTLEKKLSTDAPFQYTYIVVDCPFAIENYRSTLAVECRGDDAYLKWSAEFIVTSRVCKKGQRAFEELLGAGISAIEKSFET